MRVSRSLTAIAAASLLLVGTLGATEPIRVELEFIPDIDGGRWTYEVCARCHLPEAWGNNDGTYPQLAGQHVNVLMKQLLDIRSGRRSNPSMQPFVQERTVGGYQELSDVVAYISTLPMNPAPDRGPWPPGDEKHGDGERIYAQNCAACHGTRGEGDNALSYPRLQGQHFSYMMRQARMVRNDLRIVDPAMAAQFHALGEAEIEKVLNFVSHLPVPEQDLAPDPDWRNPDFQ